MVSNLAEMQVLLQFLKKKKKKKGNFPRVVEELGCGVGVNGCRSSLGGLFYQREQQTLCLLFRKSVRKHAPVYRLVNKHR